MQSYHCQGGTAASKNWIGRRAESLPRTQIEIPVIFHLSTFNPEVLKTQRALGLLVKTWRIHVAVWCCHFIRAFGYTGVTNEELWERCQTLLQNDVRAIGGLLLLKALTLNGLRLLTWQLCKQQVTYLWVLKGRSRLKNQKNRPWQRGERACINE